MIFTLDFGTGTQDLLLVDQNEKYKENYIKLVLPSYSLNFFNKVKKMKGDIFVEGDLIGGGPFKKALEKHLKKGYRVIFDNNAYKTVRDSIEEVIERGFEVGEKPENIENIIQIKEFESSIYENLFNYFDICLNDIETILVACQDHGFRDMQGTEREFRLSLFEKKMKEDNSIFSFLYKDVEIPETFLRMNQLSKRIRKEGFKGELYFMDTVFAACVGVAGDERFKSDSYNLIINFGNSHTLAVIVKDFKIIALMEHHTRILEKNIDMFKSNIKRFIQREISSKEVMSQNGHGIVYMEEQLPEINNIFVTGPRRYLAQELTMDFKYATPWGDMMITGNVGLLKSYKKRVK